MKKLFVSILFLSLFIFALPIAFGDNTQEIMEKTEPPAKTDVYYPTSLVHRSLLTPEKLLETSASLHYRNVLEGYGTDFNARGSYGFYRDMAATAGLRLIAASDPGSFKAGGIVVGGQFRLLSEKPNYPETVLSLELGTLGYAQLTENKRSPVLVMPGVKAKKGITETIAVTGESTLGIGNRVGLVRIKGGGIAKLHPLFDTSLTAEWTNLGFPEPTTVAISPTLYYHFKQILDLSAGIDVGLYGGSSIGNNLRLGIAAAF